MKAVITDVQKQPMQLNILVTYKTDANVKIADRVLIFPDETFENMTKDVLKEAIIKEGKRYQVTDNRETEYKTLINQVINIP